MESITRQAMFAIVNSLAALDVKLDTWAYDSLISCVGIAVQRGYAKGQADVLECIEKLSRTKSFVPINPPNIEISSKASKF